MKTARRRPTLRTALTVIAALAIACNAFVWCSATTGPLNASGTNATVAVWQGYIDVMVDGLHGEYPRRSAGRSVHIGPGLVRGLKLPAYWYRHDRPIGALRIQIPLFFPFVVLLVWTVWGWVRYRRRLGHECAACGYDLSGGTGMCPECGQAANDHDRN